MSAPVNVRLVAPSEIVEGWEPQAEEWRQLNVEVRGNPEFYPLTIKAAYAIGVIHDLCESVNYLLQHARVRETTYIPAYGVFGAAIDLLGRCLRGNQTTHGSSKDLKAGLRWLAPSTASQDPTHLPKHYVLIRTSMGEYTVGHLAALRHFAAHGQATSERVMDSVDYEILEQARPLLRDGLERYWHVLQESEPICNKLAAANILAVRHWPVSKSWRLFQGDGSGTSITEIFDRFDWGVR